MVSASDSKVLPRTDTPGSKVPPKRVGERALPDTDASPLRRPDLVHQVQHVGNEDMEMYQLQSPNLIVERASDFLREDPNQLSRWKKSTTAFKRFWKTHVEVDVDLDSCRDYLALERTFLSYIRTASAFALFGISAAQLFRLDNEIDRSQVSSFYHLGRPVGAVAEVIAIVIVLIGAGRCWVQQQKILRGCVRGGGWELFVFIGLAGALLLVVLIFLAGDTATGLAD